MKNKSSQIQNVERKVNGVFSQRNAKSKSYGFSKRVPKQDHYAITIQKKSLHK